MAAISNPEPARTATAPGGPVEVLWRSARHHPGRLGAREGRSVAVMIAVMSLSSADGGAMGALAGPLERSFHFGNTRLGLLVTVSSIVGAAGCLPMGLLADRVNRVRLLSVTVALWAACMIAMAFAGSFASLLAARAALGVAGSASGPVVASLTGDLFPAGRRGRIYGLLLTGDILGSGAGLLGSVMVSSLVDWRAAFLSLSLVSIALAIGLRFALPEPPRDGSSPIDPPAFPLPLDASGRVDHGLLLREDPDRMSLRRAALYVLRVPTNRVLILSSALGYFFFAGLRTFAVIFARSHFGLGSDQVGYLIIVVGAGALIGTVGGGRLADRMATSGRPGGRMMVAGATLAGSALLFAPGLLSRSVAVSLPLFVGAAALLGAQNPPVDAARLDVMPARLWGRAESVRTMARTLLEGCAPLVFGLVSSLFAPSVAGGAHDASAAGADPGAHNLSSGASSGLGVTFLVMLGAPRGQRVAALQPPWPLLHRRGYCSAFESNNRLRFEAEHPATSGIW